MDAVAEQVANNARELAAGIGLTVEALPCDPALADTAAFCEAYGYSLDDSANTIVVVGKSTPPRYAACVVLATTRLDVNGVVRRRLEARKASFAGADETAELTGMTMGGVTPFALPEGLPLWIDAAVMARESVVVGGGSRSLKLVLPPAVIAAVAGAEVVDDLAKPAG